MRRLEREFVVLLVIVVSGAIPGCTTFQDRGATDSAASLSSPPGAASRDIALVSYDESERSSASRSPLKMDDFAPSKIGTTVKRLSGQGPDRKLAQQLYDEGESLYQEAVAARERDGEADASGTFLEASEKYAGAAARWPDSALEEDALFRAGECQFFADRYVKANDSFEELLKKYPNSRYLDLVGARRFIIAKYWIELNESDGSSRFSLNLTDKQRPWSDTFGHAIRIYDRMRLDDPTGKLADDATIAAANALFARGEYPRADQYYSDLRLNFPSSEHQFMAHYLGIQAKLRGYRGPEFAGDVLDQAETLVKQVRKQFPTQAREHEEELAKAYREVRYRKAEREWVMAEYYSQRSQFGAARFYCELILQDFGETAFAEKAREMMLEVSDKPRTPPQRLTWLVDLFPDGKSPGPVMASAPDGVMQR